MQKNIYIEDWKAQQQNKDCSTLRSMESMENSHETLNYHGFGTKKKLNEHYT